MNTKWAAEAGSNHNQDLERARRLVETAAEIGCWGVKFQSFKIEEMYAAETLAKRPDLMARKAWELPDDFVPELSDLARKRGLAFGLSPYSLRAVEKHVECVDFWKIGSYAILWRELLEAVALTDRPVVLSTGMATEEEIEAAAGLLAEVDELYILYCDSSYPANPENVDVFKLNTLEDVMGCAVGYSDHTRSPDAIRRVMQYPPTMLEFHLDLDGKGHEYPPGHCWLPEEIEPLIHGRTATQWYERLWRHDPTDGKRPMKGAR